jgi:diguanylate cyclase (GGDEF)-like protein
VLGALLVPAFLIAAVVCAVTAVASWKRRERTPAAGYLSGTFAAVTFWCLGAALLEPGRLSDALPVDVLLVAHWACYAAVEVSVTGLFLLARSVTDPHWRPRARLLVVLVAVPVALLAVLALAPHLWFPAPALAGVVRLGTGFGPFFGLHSLYCYGLSALAVALLLRARRRAPRYFRRQLDSLTLAALPPVVATVLDIVFHDQLRGTDLSPLAFTVTALVDSYALFRQGLLTVVPIARDRVWERIADAVVVVDTDGRVVDVNDEARRLVAAHRPDRAADEPVVGGLAAELLGQEFLRPVREGQESRRTSALADGTEVESRTSELLDRRGRPLGQVLVLRDVSELVFHRRALQEANGRLQDQLRLNEELRAELAEDTVRDPLTGLHNRRHLDRALERAHAALAVPGNEESLSVVVFDVDHFKAVNDTHGHGVGDAVLVAVAGVLSTAWRSGDVARLGGEEFVALLPGPSSTRAAARAQDVLDRIAALRVPAADGDVRVTISAGIATARHGDGSVADLLATADSALYAAKAAGRNRVVHADAVRETTPA